MFGLWAADSHANAWKSASRPRFTVKLLAQVDALPNELLPRSLDAGEIRSRPYAEPGAVGVKFTPN